VPRFELSAGGAGLSPEAIRDVISVTYNDSITDIDSVDVVVNNWDVDNRMWDEICIEWVDGRSYTMLVDTGDYPYPFLKMQRTVGLEERSGDVLIGLEYMYKPKFGHIGKVLDRLIGRRQIEKTAERLLENIVRRVRDRVWAYSVTVETILATKGRDVLTVSPEQTVAETARRRWREYLGPRDFLVDHLTLVQNTLEKRWTTVAEFSLQVPVSI